MNSYTVTPEGNIIIEFHNTTNHFIVTGVCLNAYGDCGFCIKPSWYAK